MSNFTCEYCGTDCIDSEQGYVTGCGTYPPDFGDSSCKGCKLGLPLVDDIHYTHTKDPFICCMEKKNEKPKS